MMTKLQYFTTTLIRLNHNETNLVQLPRNKNLLENFFFDFLLRCHLGLSPSSGLVTQKFLELISLFFFKVK
jgi:hypothetical protein